MVKVDAAQPAPPGSMQGMAHMTGDPDRDFLRMMSDHHTGLIALLHPTIEMKANLASKVDARKMDKAQDAEIEMMAGMLSRHFKDEYEPKVMPEHQQMAGGLKSQSGTAYDRRFYENIIVHHRQALKLVNEYLPKAKMADIRTMAEKMKVDQTREITEFEKKLTALPQ